MDIFNPLGKDEILVLNFPSRIEHQEVVAHYAKNVIGKENSVSVYILVFWKYIFLRIKLAL